MSIKAVFALCLAGVLAGILIGYLLWGQGIQKLADELARTKASWEELQGRLAVADQRSKDQQLQSEAKLKQTDTQLKQAREDLQLERQRRARLELLLSEGRK